MSEDSISELSFLSAAAMAERIRKRDISPVELAEAHLAKIERLNPKLNAYVHTDSTRVRLEALVAESAVSHSKTSGGTLGPLHPGPGMKLPEDLEGRGQDGLGVVDATVPSQPLTVVKVQLRAFERPQVASRIRQRLLEVGVQAAGVCEQAPGAVEELVEPGGWRPVYPGLDPLEESPCFDPALGAGGGRGQVGHAEVGDVVVPCRSVVGEQLTELAVGRGVVGVR